MSDVIFRQGIRTQLRPLERADIPTLRRWVNDPDVMLFMKRPFAVMEQEEETWFEKLSASKNIHAFGIVERGGSKLIGTIDIHNIVWHQRTATSGTLLGEKEFWGKGYGTEAKMLLLDFAFNALDLHGVLSRVMGHNERSLAYAKKCGYEEVGRLPNWMRRHDGERCDEVYLIVTQERWRPLWEEYVKKRAAAK